MGKIVWSTNVTLDGVVQDPDGKEGFRHGGWFGQFGGQGPRGVGQDLARRGAGRAGPAARPAERRVVRHPLGSRASGEWADRLNGLPKYVVSATLDEARWGNGTVLRGDVVSEVSALKERLDGEIVVYASYQLGRTLLAHDLVDELRLTVFPVALGAGRAALRRVRAATSRMRLADTRDRRRGPGFLTYELVRS